MISLISSHLFAIFAQFYGIQLLYFKQKWGIRVQKYPKNQQKRDENVNFIGVERLTPDQ